MRASNSPGVLNISLQVNAVKNKNRKITEEKGKNLKLQKKHRLKISIYLHVLINMSTCGCVSADISLSAISVSNYLAKMPKCILWLYRSTLCICNLVLRQVNVIH